MVIGRRMFLCFGLCGVFVASAGGFPLVWIYGIRTDVASGRMSPDAIASAFDKHILLSAVALGLALVLCAVAVIFTNRSINGVLRRIYGRMDEAAGKIDGTSYEVLQSGWTLADTASQQTVALEQTSARLEQITAMTRAFVENSGKAEALIEQSDATIGGTADSVEKLTESMREMGQAASESQCIIRDIDQIAFQTNLLAFNAGVEAARAGDAGLGFSVIAEEIRHLATRSGEAAKRTAELIANTIRKVRESSEFVSETADAFRTIAGSSAEIRQYIAGIASASHEQAQGVEQTHTALAEISQASEKTAANASNLSDASTELSAQSEAIRESLGELIKFVYGQGSVSIINFAKIQNEIEELASLAHIRQMGPEKHQDVLQRWLTEHAANVEAVYTNTGTGDFVVSIPPAGLANASVRPWWQKAIRGEKYVSPPYVSSITQKPCCTISLPIYDASGRINGVLGVDLRL
ncbi:MAG: methyl-accepting chemotaxis protein [Syntrophobacteraceae bacterium]|nr:methyl-accepting chemotaxis protein [Syntrophobacteraceae bacterium]